MTVFFVIGTIIVFLAIEAVLHRARVRRGVETAAGVLPGRKAAYPVRLPDGIFFARSHTWLNLFPSGKGWLGVDDFVGRLLKKPEVVLLKAAGSEVRKGDPILTLREGDRSLTIRAPMDGEILATNESIRDHPELLKEMLFTDGWAYMLKPQKPSQLRQMLLGGETRQWIADEFTRLRDLFTQEGASKVAPALLQDGGSAADGALEGADRHIWELFDRTFLRESG